MQNYSYHTHTNALGRFDGKNTAEEMIQKAQEIGFQAIGITNHLIYHPNMPVTNTMAYNDLGAAIADYQQIIDEIRTASRQFSIKVYAGFEVDFFPSKQWRDDFEEIRAALGADYYIGSSHYMRNADETLLINPYDVLIHGQPCPAGTLESCLPLCWENVVESIKSQYFAFIAHLDLYKIFNLGTDSQHDIFKRKIIDALAEYNQPYEINTSGWNKAGEQHPHTWMVSELVQRNVPVVISDDAHSVAMLGQHYGRAEALLSELNCKNRWFIKD